MSQPAYVDRNFNCIPNCGSKDGCADGICKVKQTLVAKPTAESILLRLVKAQDVYKNSGSSGRKRLTESQELDAAWIAAREWKLNCG